MHIAQRPSTTTRDVFDWQLQEALMRDPRAARALVGVYTRDEHWPLRTDPQQATLSTRAVAGPQNTWCLSSSRTQSRLSTFPTALRHWSPYTNVCGAWATRTYVTGRKYYRAHSQGSADSTLSTSWPCKCGACPWGWWLAHSGNRFRLHWAHYQAPPGIAYIHTDQGPGLSLGRLSASGIVTSKPRRHGDPRLRTPLPHHHHAPWLSMVIKAKKNPGLYL